MVYLILILIALGGFAALSGIISGHRGSSDDIVVSDVANCATCSGADAACEQECMMAAAVKEIEYFNDEELDAYSGRPSDQYTDDEAEQFREVLFTMRPDEVKAWNRSLILRGINMPNQIKDEFIALGE